VSVARVRRSDSGNWHTKGLLLLLCHVACAHM
jgi:hypothetical protein